MKTRDTLFAILLLSLLAHGCALMQEKPGLGTAPPAASVQPSGPKPEAPRGTEIGNASWYGPQLHGKKTASGVIYDQSGFTAAHRHLPLGSKVRVINLENERSVEVEINDRGPFVPGRIIDLSRAAARALGMLEDGIARVRIELLALPTKVKF
jgi:rare lipoprotein A (peptidoglycan hydrolase)